MRSPRSLVSLLLLLLFVTAARSEDSPGHPVCYLCGSEGFSITKPDEVLPIPATSIPNGTIPEAFANEPFTCANAQRFSDMGYISPGLCASVNSLSELLLEFCGCVSLTNAPSLAPTQLPTTSPTTEAPTNEPTASPTTSEPTASPTELPTSEPTISPTELPTEAPTTLPTEAPTNEPTVEPTEAPTNRPTGGPTANPTKTPTQSPTDLPTTEPTAQPTVLIVTNQPTQTPTRRPTARPTATPTKEPTASPTKQPSFMPTRMPVVAPTTNAPTRRPTRNPTNAPTRRPTNVPTRNPSIAPVVPDTKSPTERPTTAPSPVPTGVPTRSPSSAPSVSHEPTTSMMPSAVPTPSFQFDKMEFVKTGIRMVLSTTSGGGSRRQLQLAGPRCDNLWISKVRDRIEGEVIDSLQMYEMIQVELDDAYSEMTSSGAALVFSVSIAIRSPASDHNFEQYVEGPFDTQAERQSFSQFLRSTGCEAFQDVVDLSLEFPADTTTDATTKSANSPPVGLIAGVAMASVSILGLAAVFLYMRAKRKQRESNEAPDGKMVSDQASLIGMEQGALDVSTLGDPIPESAAGRSREDQSTLGESSLPYDFQKAYLDVHSSNMEGGPQGTVSSLEDQGLTGVVPSPFEDISIGTGFSMEDQFEVVAPPGQLGLILESNAEDGCPSVHKVKPTSVLANVVHIGDRLLSVDSEDVTNMTANEVSHIIAAKKRERRIFVFARSMSKGRSGR